MSHEVVCLQDHPELVEKCAILLNGQWPRSLSSRLRSLEQTNNSSFPTSLLLIQKKDNDDQVSVIGHSKILPVPHSNDACFVESVVIDASLRKRGLGRIIMEETENFVRKKGIKAVHLTTHDQQGFYSKLGYRLSEPVVVYGGISSNLQQFIEIHTTNNNKSGTCDDDEKPSSSSSPSLPQQEHHDKNNTCQLTTVQKSSPLPPPPPPPPIVPTNNNLSMQKVYMVKYL